MTNQFIDQAIPGVRALRPYQPGKPEDELAREYGLNKIVKLASNENPLGPSARVVETVAPLIASVGRYPDDNGFMLKSTLAETHGVNRAQITLGNGSCNILELILRTFADQGSKVVFSAHAFAMYAILTQLAGAKASITPARSWGHDLDAMANAVDENTAVVFIANPNNPTGTWIGENELSTFLSRVRENVIVVVDEAYFEYASYAHTGATHYPDALTFLKKHPNLVVTRTFSKAYALAGLRVGYAVSHADVADLINRVRQPFNVNSLALVAAQAALNDHTHLEKSLDLNVAGLEQLSAGFAQAGLYFIKSAANFVCVDVGQPAAQVYERLLKRGIIVRPIGDMPSFLRVTVGTVEENAQFLGTLKEVL